MRSPSVRALLCSSRAVERVRRTRPRGSFGCLVAERGRALFSTFFHECPCQDPAWAQRTWQILRDAIGEIHRKNASHLSFEELYRNSYNMVLYKYADLLYRNVSEVIQSRLKELCAPVEAAHDDTFLDELNKAWSEHKLSMSCIRDILLYMDRCWVGTTNQVREARDGEGGG